MKEPLFGDLCVIAMPGCEEFAERVDSYLKEWHRRADSYLVPVSCPRFGTGEAKGVINHSVRGHDIYIICDVFNYGVTYKMYGQTVPMSPDDHFADLKRVIAASAGKAKRLSLIMPMLYEGRQHKRSGRESLDCALMLQELVQMGVSNILTFDAHDARVQNAIPLTGFDDVRPAYQMIKALVRHVPDITIDKDHLMIISPDEGAMQRCIFYGQTLGVDIGMFYKRRDFSQVVNGVNPIVAHEYLGQDLNGKDAIIIDDMIASGTSLLKVAAHLKESGAKRVFAFTTFGLFTSGLELFDKAVADGMIEKIFTTNLVYRPAELRTRDWYVEVNMCKYVAYLIENLHHDESISNLLNPSDRINNLMQKHLAEVAERDS